MITAETSPDPHNIVPALAAARLARRDAIRQFLRRYKANKLGIVGAVMLAIVLLAALFAPLIAPYDPNAPTTIDTETFFNPPSPAHPFGTDDAGGDVLSLVLYGARISLLVGFVAAFISMVVGGGIGLLAGYFAGKVGDALMRFTRFFLVIPAIAIIIVLVAVVGPSLRNIILVIGLFGWTTTALLVRAAVLSIRERKFIARARAMGAGHWHIMRKHVFPLVLPLMMAKGVLDISYAILSESALAFIGLGDPTVTSWGQMINFAFNRAAISNGAWWALLVPGLAITWVVLATTFIGTALEEIFNPRLRTNHLGGDEKMVDMPAVGEAAA